MGKVRGMRWWMIGLVTSGLIVNYIARNSLAVAAPEMNRLLSISTAQYSYIVASFQGAYMIMQPVAGYVLDVVGTKIGFALFAIAWSGACMLHGAANGWISLAVFRGMLGLTEAAGIPSGLNGVVQQRRVDRRGDRAAARRLVGAAWQLAYGVRVDRRAWACVERAVAAAVPCAERSATPVR
jgi:MFS family permease